MIINRKSTSLTLRSNRHYYIEDTSGGAINAGDLVEWSSGTNVPLPESSETKLNNIESGDSLLGMSYESTNRVLMLLYQKSDGSLKARFFRCTNGTISFYDDLDLTEYSSSASSKVILTTQGVSDGSASKFYYSYATLISNTDGTKARARLMRITLEGNSFSQSIIHEGEVTQHEASEPRNLNKIFYAAQQCTGDSDRFYVFSQQNPGSSTTLYYYVQDIRVQYSYTTPINIYFTSETQFANPQILKVPSSSNNYDSYNIFTYTNSISSKLFARRSTRRLNANSGSSNSEICSDAVTISSAFSHFSNLVCKVNNKGYLFYLGTDGYIHFVVLTAGPQGSSAFAQSNVTTTLNLTGAGVSSLALYTTPNSSYGGDLYLVVRYSDHFDIYLYTVTGNTISKIYQSEYTISSNIIYDSSSSSLIYMKNDNTIIVHKLASGTLKKRSTGKIKGVLRTKSNYYDVSLLEVYDGLQDHNVINYPALAATCTTAGYTASAKCSRCNTWTIPKINIPALGHTPSSTTVQIDNNDTQHRTRCSRCSQYYLVNHSYGNWINNNDLNRTTWYRTDSRFCSLCRYEQTKLVRVCGDNITYILDDTAQTVTLSGTGDMYDCDASNAIPVPNGYQVILSEGITSIGNYAFYGRTISNINLPSSLTRIGDHAFHNTNITQASSGFFSVEYSSLQSGKGYEEILPLRLPALTYIGEYAFAANYTYAIIRLIINTDSLETIGNGAFVSPSQNILSLVFTSLLYLKTISVKNEINPNSNVLIFDGQSSSLSILNRDGTILTISPAKLLYLPYFMTFNTKIGTTLNHYLRLEIKAGTTNTVRDWDDYFSTKASSGTSVSFLSTSTYSTYC